MSDSPSNNALSLDEAVGILHALAKERIREYKAISCLEEAIKTVLAVRAEHHCAATTQAALEAERKAAEVKQAEYLAAVRAETERKQEQYKALLSTLTADMQSAQDAAAKAHDDIRKRTEQTVADYKQREQAAMKKYQEEESKAKFSLAQYTAQTEAAQKTLQHLQSQITSMQQEQKRLLEKWGTKV